MRDLSIIIATLSLFFSLQHVAICAQIYTPPDNIALDCGSSTSGNSAVPGGRKWTGDKDSKVALIEESSSKSVSATALSQSSSILRVPYLTARISISQFTYVFPVTAGQKFIRLHFYPAQYQGFDRSKNFFSVKVGSYSLLNNFSASLTAQYLGEASFFKEFCVNLEQNQSLTVTFTPSMSMSYAFINGIEVVSMPTNLYYSRLDDQGLPFIGQEAQFQINNYTALENVHRLNIGGNSIPAVNDTGMYRNWYDDYFYLVPAGVVASNTSIKLDYSIIPQYTAPDDVYRTARSMGSNRTDNLLYNLTWRLPVDSGFRYLVRLHFCEFDPYVETVSDRRFSIYIDNKTAEAAFDVMEASGGKGRPMYKDYVVMIGNTGDKSEYTLFIALHPKNLFSAYADGFLNGLEVFKLNNSGGNLAGPNPAPQAPPAGNEESSPKAEKSNTKRKLLFSIGGCGIGLLIILVLLCCIIVWRHRKMHWYGAYCKGSRQGAREFKTEIEMLSQLRHIHLVSLIGYCNDNSEMILVYDYMINGTLRDHLYDTKNDPLTWKQRLKICHGAAIGLNYLHTEVKYTIIHRDVKTSNILLDEKFSAKVSDFGLSKMDPKIDVVNTGVKGTWGYLDPEYARGHALTEKSDVYSFGVVLFEVLCARKALDQKLAVDQVNLAHWVKKCIADGTLYQIIDPRLRGKISPECFKVFVEIAESCIQEAGVNRPLMNDVMEKLGFALELQETADAGKEKINPAGEHSYQDILFPLARDIDVDTLGSNVIAAPNPVHDSGSSLSYDIFSSTICPKEL
ncbi:Serine-threonine/tyrosine-protein kinase [Theobroma cacao]|nr:Serine-threonine/tyrosine-protein kinase [Theobroma cacao]